MARVFLSNETYNAATSGANILGAAGTEQVNVLTGTIGLNIASSVDRVDLSGNIADYTFSSFGAAMTIRDATGSVVGTVSDSGGKSIVFADGALSAVYAGTTLSLGGVALTGTAAPIAPAAADIDATTTSDAAGGTTGGTTGGVQNLSVNTDTLVGTSGVDTFVGAAGTVANADVIVDTSSTDSDIANLTVTAAYNPTNISGIENVNLDWDAFGTATYNVTNIEGANNITLTSSKVGFLGSAAVTAGANKTVTAGSGMDGTLTLTGTTTSVTVNGGEATGVSVTGTGTANVTAGSATTSVTTSGYTTATIDAGTATTVSVTDAAVVTDATVLTVNANATITNGTTGALTLNLSNGNSVTLDAIGASLDVGGTGDVVINSTALTTETATNSKTSGTLTYVSSDANAHDVDQIAADLIRFTGNVNGAITAANGANLEFAAATTATDITVAGTGTSDVVNVAFTGTTPTATALTLSGVETLNLNAAATAGVGDDFTVTTLDLDTASNQVVVTGSNDINLGNITGTGTVDASAGTGSVTFTQVAADNTLTLIGSSAATNSATFAATTADSNYTGGSGNDTVVFATTTGSAVAAVGAGTNSITGNALTTGDLVVVSGTGNDTVSATALTTGNVTMQLGDGTNSATLDGVFAGVNIAYVGGSGIDTVTIDDATAATDTINLSFGGGTADTLVISEDITDGTFTVSGLERIDVGAAAATAVVDGELLNGQSFELLSNGSNVGGVFNTTLLVEMDTAGTLDLSNIVLNATITDGIAGVSVTGNAGNDVITGTSGNDIIGTTGGNDVVTGGAGFDIMTGAGGIDTFVISAGDSGITAATIDRIGTFTSGTDKLQLGTAGTAANYVEADGNGATATFADALTLANTAFNGTVQYYLSFDVDADLFGAGGSADGLLFVDSNLDGTADYSIGILGAATAAAFDFGDIIA